MRAIDPSRQSPMMIARHTPQLQSPVSVYRRLSPPAAARAPSPPPSQTVLFSPSPGTVSRILSAATPLSPTRSSRYDHGKGGSAVSDPFPATQNAPPPSPVLQPQMQTIFPVSNSVQLQPRQPLQARAASPMLGRPLSPPHVVVSHPCHQSLGAIPRTSVATVRSFSPPLNDARLSSQAAIQRTQRATLFARGSGSGSYSPKGLVSSADGTVDGSGTDTPVTPGHTSTASAEPVKTNRARALTTFVRSQPYQPAYYGSMNSVPLPLQRAVTVGSVQVPRAQERTSRSGSPASRIVMHTPAGSFPGFFPATPAVNVLTTGSSIARAPVSEPLADPSPKSNFSPKSTFSPSPSVASILTTSGIDKGTPTTSRPSMTSTNTSRPSRTGPPVTVASMVAAAIERGPPARPRYSRATSVERGVSDGASYGYSRTDHIRLPVQREDSSPPRFCQIRGRTSEAAEFPPNRATFRPTTMAMDNALPQSSPTQQCRNVIGLGGTSPLGVETIASPVGSFQGFSFATSTPHTGGLTVSLPVRCNRASLDNDSAPPSARDSTEFAHEVRGRATSSSWNGDDLSDFGEDDDEVDAAWEATEMTWTHEGQENSKSPSNSERPITSQSHQEGENMNLEDDGEEGPVVFRARRLSRTAGETLAKNAADNLAQLASARSSIGSEVISAALAGVAETDKAMHPLRAEAGHELLVGTSDLHMQHVRGTSPPPLRRSPTGSCCLVQDSQKDRSLVERLIFDSMPKRFVRIESVASVINPRLANRFLERVAAEKACVEATFHGTRVEHVDNILRAGLLPESSSTKAYGHGVYVGTHAGVAHQYADPGTDGRRFMCVVLVVVGSEVVKGEQGQMAAVTAMDRLVNPTQYCFVDADRLLVSHLITYRVACANRRRIGGGWEDPFQDKLSSALRRDATRRRRKGKR
eukprot:TRINITY_DN38343_c0_g2_i1.p1 TRINITY_DN38343_c0_g2~~TRINITY_DN38343_c0_g2_i1.p1  ORF type:complete len:923 (+),score=95.06 TRINITY_DN38343_c0_g2_i1:117-2885(+)